MDSNSLEQAYAALKAGDKKAALGILAPYVKANPEDEKGWLLLFNCVDSEEQKRYCLERILSINPEHQKARQALEKLEGRSETPSRRKKAETKQGSALSRLPIWAIGIIGASVVGFVLCVGVLGYVTLSRLLPGEQVAEVAVETSYPTRVFSPAPTSAPPATFTAVPSLTPIGGGEIPSSGPAACVPANQPDLATVNHIVDGDTIDVSIHGKAYRVRYIGIDTPEEPDDPYSAEASARNAELVGGQIVRLVKDQSESDPFNSLLRYVFVGDTFVNYELVRDGYASAKEYPPDTACASTFAQAENEARGANLGLWAFVAIPDSESRGQGTIEPEGLAVDIRISDIFYDGAVPQVESDEYAVISNLGTQAVNLDGWRLNAGNPGQDFYFPDFILEPGESCRVYTDEIHNDGCGFSFHNDEALWNNKGDCGKLWNEAQMLVDEYCY